MGIVKTKMSCIHFKFSNTVENEKLKFDGLQISLSDLRDAIIKLKNLKANLYSLKIIDAQTKKGKFSSSSYCSSSLVFHFIYRIHR